MVVAGNVDVCASSPASREHERVRVAGLRVAELNATKSNDVSRMSVTGSRGRGVVEGIGLGAHRDNRVSSAVEQSPWATSSTSTELSQQYDVIDSHLTTLITEKTSLVQESSRLLQRGGKTLREKSRLATVELRLDELEREISSDRRQLAARPA